MIIKKLLVVGHLAKDIVKTKYGLGEFWGGAGYHVAMSAAMFLPAGTVVLRSATGNDFDRGILGKAGVETKYIDIDRSTISDRHMIDESTNDRLYRSEGNISDNLKLELSSELMNGVGWIHLASSPPTQQLKWLKQIENYDLKDVIISIDTFDTFAVNSPEAVRSVFLKANMGFLNQKEWDCLEGINMNIKLIRKLGEKGAAIYNHGKLELEVGIPQSNQVKDTTGAGEVVAGVFIAAKLKGKSDREALTEACTWATKSIEDFGTDHLRN